MTCTGSDEITFSILIDEIHNDEHNFNDDEAQVTLTITMYKSFPFFVATQNMEWLLY